MSIKAIETTYAGYNFRSRLEARVAATLDKLGAVWEYEPEAFQIDGGVNYLPDFRVGGSWIEVKPKRAGGDSKIGLMAAADPTLRCYLVYPDTFLNERDHLSLMRVRGVGFAASAVWSRCPQCGAVAPWTLYDDQPPPCCGRSSPSDQWWDWHYGPSKWGGLVIPRLPQYRDGRMDWSNR